MDLEFDTGTTATGAPAPATSSKDHAIKCVVWDLDNTVWNGVLIEDVNVTLRPEAVELIRIFDERGILQSVASKNDADLAMAKLKAFGLDEFFLYPQIHWNPKSDSIARIAADLNIGIDTFAFLDDQPFEREEVAFAHPKVLTLDSTDLSGIADMKVMIPRFITEDSKRRREMYRSDIVRKEVEEQYVGAQDEFLSTLAMTLSITRAKEEDLKRAEELTQRTNQLNTTGYTYDYDELAALSRSDDHLLLVAELDDKYGTYGKIGLVLVETSADRWSVKLLLMSCRVMSRGVGGAMITLVRNLARNAGVRLQAEFVETDRNRMMYMTYRFNQFKEVEQNGAWKMLENDLTTIPAYPTYLALHTDL